NDNTPTVSGTAEANSVVAILEAGVLSQTVNADANGAWSTTLSTLMDGSYAFTATATDAAGNTSVASTSVSIEVDTVAPEAPVITAPTTGTITNNNTPTFAGTAEAGSSVEIFEGANSLGMVSADANGDWSFTSPVLADDLYMVTATATDNANNTSGASTSVEITIDTAVPVISSVTSITPDGIYGIGQEILVSVNWSEAVFVIGSPELTLEVGGTTVADYVGGTGTNTLTFSYTVQMGHESADLDYSDSNAFSLNGGSIEDVALNQADTTLMAPGSAGSLGANQDLVIVNDFPPAAPTELAQFQIDGVTAIVAGGISTQSGVHFRGSVVDPTAAQLLKIEIEVQPLGTPFVGTPTSKSAFVLNGSMADVLEFSLANALFHWQARSVDDLGLTSDWVSFGNNEETHPDLIIEVTPSNASPDVPQAEGQFQSNGIHPIPTAGEIGESALLFKGKVSDPDGDVVRLEIEVSSVGMGFSNTPTFLGEFVPSGTDTEVLATPLLEGAGVWQYRTRDAGGAVSAWSSYGSNDDLLDADFIVSLSTNSAPRFPSDLSQHADSYGPAQPESSFVDEGNLVFKGVIKDSDPLQLLALDIEIKPIGTDFTGTPTSSGKWLPS
ncbi:MAG: Ig-like domain-containing protein, partial [Planctomycetota bacterium]|nr:Ig-like domain-containing protein [Planctomycetota bacterium]